MNCGNLLYRTDTSAAAAAAHWWNHTGLCRLEWCML